MSFFKRVAAVVAAAAAAMAVTAAPARAGGYELYQTQEFWCVGVQELPHLGAGPWVETVQLCQVVAGVNVTAYIPDSYCNCVAFYTRTPGSTTSRSSSGCGSTAPRRMCRS